MFNGVEDERLTEIPDTRDSLLVRVRDPGDQEAWEQFAAIYRPVAYRLARAHGLQDADAEELAQSVLIAMAKAIANWEPVTPQVRFRHWLRRVAKNAILNALSRRPQDQAVGGGVVDILLVADTAPSPEASDEIDLEYQRQLYRRAAEIVRHRADQVTWLAFSLTMIDGLSIADAARQLQRSEGLVYAARSRIIRRLRDVVRELDGEVE